MDPVRAEADFRVRIQEMYRDILGQPVRDELFNHMLPFWLSHVHPEDGATVGLVDEDLQAHPESTRGLVFTARMLWSFASLALAGFPEASLDRGRREYQVLRRDFYDPAHGGYVYAAKPGGQVTDDSKLVYAQSFVIYALAAWYRASGETSALEDAVRLFRLLEDRCRIQLADTVVYGEAYTADLQKEIENPIAEGESDGAVTMNTTLHLLEAYTGLYEAWPDDTLRTAVIDLTAFVLDKIYDPYHGKLHVFLNRNLEPTDDLWSLGHDIEAAWLIEHTADVLEARGGLSASEKLLTARVHTMCRHLEESVLPAAIETLVLPSGRDGLWHANEVRSGETDRTRIWWVQAEALSALLNAGIRREDERCLEMAVKLWRSMEELMVDHRPGGEWHAELTELNEPRRMPAADPWKALYHNGRTCLNIISFFEL